MFNKLLPPHKDPAEPGHLRFFYRDWRPTRFGRLWSRLFAWVSGLGLTPQILLTLQVKDRSTGRLHEVILAVARYQGQRYLVSMLGNGSEWVQNVRAAGGKACIKRGRSHPVLLTEVPAKERAPILKAWCQVETSGRHHLPNKTKGSNPLNYFTENQNVPISGLPWRIVCDN